MVDTLSRCVPGKIVLVDYVKDDVIKSSRLLILQVQLTDSYNGNPYRTLIGVETRDEPPSPLTVGSRLVTDRTAVIQANIPSPALENVYMRYRSA